MDIPGTTRACWMRNRDLVCRRIGNIGGSDVGSGKPVRRRHRTVSRAGQPGDGYVVSRRGCCSERRNHDRSTGAGDSFEGPVQAVTAHGPLVRSTTGDRCTENVCRRVCDFPQRSFYPGTGR